MNALRFTLCLICLHTTVNLAKGKAVVPTFDPGGSPGEATRLGIEAGNAAQSQKNQAQTRQIRTPQVAQVQSATPRQIDRASPTSPEVEMTSGAPRPLGLETAGKSISEDRTSSVAEGSKLEVACKEEIGSSVAREIQLRERLAALAKHITDLDAAPNSVANKPVKDWMSPSQLDQFNLLRVEMRYVSFSIYGEVIRRRKLRALLTLIKAEKKDDDLYAEELANGDLGNDAIVANADISAKMNAAGFGPLNAVMLRLNDIQSLSDAQNLKINTELLQRLHVAKQIGSCYETDDMGFLFADDLTKTLPYETFKARLESELKAGNAAAGPIRDYLSHNFEK